MLQKKRENSLLCQPFSHSSNIPSILFPLFPCALPAESSIQDLIAPIITPFTKYF